MELKRLAETTTAPMIDVYRSKADEVPQLRSLLPFADIERALMRRRLMAKAESGATKSTKTKSDSLPGTTIKSGNQGSISWKLCSTIAPYAQLLIGTFGVT